MAYYLAALVIVDGLVTRNDAAWAGLPRALMLLSVITVGLVLAYRAGLSISTPGAILVGIVCAMLVSEAYRAPLIGLSLWLVYLGAFALAQAAPHNWNADLARAGALVAAFALWLRIVPPPEGAWNQNVIGAVLVVCLAAAFGWQAAPDWHKLRRWGLALAILVGILATGSRGALVGAFVVACVMFYARALVAAPALAGALVILRPRSSSLRLEYWYQGWRVFLDNLAFGVGPGRLALPGLDSRGGFDIHAHNTAITLLAQVGLVGVVVIGAFALTSVAPRITRAALAGLAGVAVHSLVDDPLIALPVGVMLAVLMAIRSD